MDFKSATEREAFILEFFKILPDLWLMSFFTLEESSKIDWELTLELKFSYYDSFKIKLEWILLSVFERIFSLSLFALWTLIFSFIKPNSTWLPNLTFLRTFYYVIEDGKNISVFTIFLFFKDSKLGFEFNFLSFFFFTLFSSKD